MIFINSRELRLRPGEVWRKLKKEGEIVITLNGKPIAIITGVDETTLDEKLTLFRRARALLAMEQMQKASIKSGLDRISSQEIESEISAVRKGRSR